MEKWDSYVVHRCVLCYIYSNEANYSVYEILQARLLAESSRGIIVVRCFRKYYTRGIGLTCAHRDIGGIGSIICVRMMYKISVEMKRNERYRFPS